MLILKDVKIYEGLHMKKYHDHVPCSYAYKIVSFDDKPIVVTD